MNTENIEIQNPIKKSEKRNSREQFRVVLNKEANESLAKVVNKVNEDFNCGSISKSDVANWFLQKLNGSISKSEIKELQELHFDEKKMLADLLKSSASRENEIPVDIRKALKEHYGFSASSRVGRKSPKSPSENS